MPQASPPNIVSNISTRWQRLFAGTAMIAWTTCVPRGIDQRQHVLVHRRSSSLLRRRSRDLKMITPPFGGAAGEAPWTTWECSASHRSFRRCFQPSCFTTCRLRPRATACPKPNVARKFSWGTGLDHRLRGSGDAGGGWEHPDRLLAGNPIGPTTFWSRAQARRRGAALVTSNGTEFARVPGLIVADWTA